MKKKTNIIIGTACIILTGVVAYTAVKLLEKKTYIDITEACSEMNNDFEDDESK